MLGLRFLLLLLSACDVLAHELKGNDTIEKREVQKNTTGGDLHPYCCYWAANEECNLNPAYMRTRCQKSCGTPGCKLPDVMACDVKVHIDGCIFNSEAKRMPMDDHPGAPSSKVIGREKTAAPPIGSYQPPAPPVIGQQSTPAPVIGQEETQAPISATAPVAMVTTPEGSPYNAIGPKETVTPVIGRKTTPTPVIGQRKTTAPAIGPYEPPSPPPIGRNKTLLPVIGQKETPAPVIGEEEESRDMHDLMNEINNLIMQDYEVNCCPCGRASRASKLEKTSTKTREHYLQK